MKIVFLSLLFSLCFRFYLTAQINDEVHQRIERWRAAFHPEKVHLHFDKPYYAAGDTMWFKAYVTTGSKNQLSAISGAMYAELINDSDSVIHYHKLPVVAGMAKGDFILPANLFSGNYRVRAYTQWMRNSDPDFFYDRPFKIASGMSAAITSQSVFTIKGAKVIAELAFTDAGRTPLKDKKLEYEIRSAECDIEKGKATTDAQGKIRLEIDTADLVSGGARLVTRIKDSKNNTTLKSFPLDISYVASDIRFFPEGGELINGILSKIAFKCVGVKGLGIPVQITIKDDKQNIITSVSSLHAGMGVFSIRPQSGSSYHAVIRFPDKSEKSIQLPSAKDNGYVLSVYNYINPDSVLVRIYASEPRFKESKEVILIAQSSGEVHFSTSLKVRAPRTSIWIPKDAFPAGIIHYTLFDDKNEPLNERLAFSDKGKMNVLVSSDKSVYNANNNIAFDVRAMDAGAKPSIGNFSVAVVNESIVPEKHVSGNSILSSLLLTSDIKGYVEEPGYYFADTSSERKAALDILMLTQGYRRFVWKKILAGGEERPVYTAEKLATSVSGSLMTFGRKPIAGGKITLLSERLGILTDTLTDSSGRFRFNPLILQDSIKFVVQGRNIKGKDMVSILMDNIPNMIVSQGNNIIDLANDTDSLFNAFIVKNSDLAASRRRNGLNGTNELSEVIISGKQPQSNRSYNLNGPGNADQEIKGSELEACGGTLLWCLQGRARGIYFNAGIAYSTRGGGSLVQMPMLLVVDGREITSEDFDYTGVLEQGLISSSDIQSVEILRTFGYTNIYGPRGANGVIIITTKPGGAGFKGKEALGILTFSPKGFYKSREFYLPRYNASPSSVKSASDPRTTVYWNPSIITDKEGRANFSFYNTGSTGTYKLTLEGINGEGNLARATYRYKVE